MRSRRDVVEVLRTLAVLQRASRFPLVFGGALAGDELRMSTLLGNTTDALRGLLMTGELSAPRHAELDVHSRLQPVNAARAAGLLP